MFARVGGNSYNPSKGDQRLRPSTLIQDIVQNEEKNKKVFHENEADSLLYHHISITQHWMMRKLKLIYRHHVEPRVKMHMPKEESFPFPLKFVGVTRNTSSSLVVMLE